MVSVRKDGHLAGRNRLRLVSFGFILFFASISAQLGYLTLWQDRPEKTAVEYSERVPRPDIVDRNGVVLATDVPVFSLYADPRKILDVDEAVELLTATVSGFDAKSLRQKLVQPNRAFVWLKREVSPAEREAIHNLGIPGIGFRVETKRVYPMGRLAAHVLGYVDLDSKGIAGIEKFLDDQGALYTASLAEDDTRARPAVLSIDMRVQHALADELAKGIAKFHAKAGGAIVLDAKSGEVLGLVSLPDFNPNQENKNFTFDQANRMTSGVFELGSVIKAVSFAMALDYGTADLTSRFDARAPLVIGRAVIHDFQPTRRILSLPEVFTNSSNIGTARMVLGVDVARHQAFLRRVGLMDRLVTELPENAKPILPKRWGRLVQATVAFGHGFAVQPLQGAQVVAGLLNDGNMLPVTFLKRDRADAKPLAHRVIKSTTSEKLRYLFRLNGLEGSARSANAKAPGYRIGGKTGTAEKVVNGRYDKSKNLTVFTGAFPMEDPQYVIMVLMDEPQATPETYGFSTSGWNAVPTGGNIVARIAPLLGIEPVLTEEERKTLAKQAEKEGRT
ncbi:peptidoglycan D,D-transpeptidase FtsI family protein [Taklimakanibacter deserti]|uniref:peptidoglycan D,D-transpeptidase FtsI family protein n=1 Tax=Taklimakanibacter deserti TaxID=2267839 RepID=UPI0013C4F6E6